MSINNRHIKIRESKEIRESKDIEFILNIKEEDITLSFIASLFGEYDGEKRFNPYDIIKIPKQSYGPDNNKNKNEFITTVGRWVFNKYFIENDLFNIFKYINKPLTKKMINKINSDLSYAFIEDKITVDQIRLWTKKCQKFMPYVTFLSPSYSLFMLTITKELNVKKKALLRQNAEAIENKDIKILDKIQTELLDYAKELLKDDPAMDMFNSGARGSFENNFKNMFVMRGAVQNPDPNKGYNIITSNYMDGISKDEYAALASSLSAGPYARAKKTEVGGYWEKLFMAAFQHITLDKPGSDCGTKKYITINVSEKNIKEIMYCYAIVGDKLVEITSDNKDQFIGKTIKMRFSSMCECKNHICNKCAGNLFYRLGITNIGAATPQVASRLKVLCLKLFHDDQVSFAEMDPMKAFGLE